MIYVKIFHDSRCFIARPYGLLTFYGPVAVGILVNWGLFCSIAKVIFAQIRTKAEKDPEEQSELTLKIVSFVNCILHLNALQYSECSKKV